METPENEILLDREVLARVDSWRSEQLDHPSLAEAVQRLVDVGLSVSTKGRGRFSEGEKLILWALRDVWRQQQGQEHDGVDLEFVHAVSAKHEWALAWKYPNLFSPPPQLPPTVSEVSRILQMWSSFESAYDQLSEDERNQIEWPESSASPKVKFDGFSVGEETEHFSVAKILVRELGEFECFEDRDLRSCYPRLDTYRRMLRVFESTMRNHPPSRLSIAEITEVLKAQIRPED